MVSVVCTLLYSQWLGSKCGSYRSLWRQCRNATAIREAKLGAQHPLNILEVGGNNVRYIKSGTGLVSRASPVQTACATVREMKEGPSGSAIRNRSQATASCCCQRQRW